MNLVIYVTLKDLKIGASRSARADMLGRTLKSSPHFRFRTSIAKDAVQITIDPESAQHLATCASSQWNVDYSASRP